MKTAVRSLWNKTGSFRAVFASKVKRTVGRYKRCRVWLKQGLRRMARGRKETAAAAGRKPAMDDVFRGLDEDRERLVDRLHAGRELYPNCDTSIWLRSCAREIPNPVPGTIDGKIPEWLSGSLLRNGPGSTRVGDHEFKHLFDSSALLHRFAFKDGTVSYQCRFLESNTYKRNKAAQRIVFTEFGTKACPDPCKTIFNRVSNVFKRGDDQSDNAMISIYPIGDQYYTFTEYPIMIRIDPTTLETLKNVNMHQRDTGIVHHTAHPHVAADGSVFNLATVPKIDGPHYCVVKFPRTDPETGRRYSTDDMFQKMIVVASVKCRWPLHPGYMHSFGVTENYFIIVEQPLSVSLSTVVLNRIRGDPMSSALKWFQDCPTIIYLVSRSDGETVKTFRSDAFFYLHIINQYEEGDRVMIDICCYRDPSMIECMYIEALKNLNKNPDYAAMFRSRPLRFVLPVNGDRQSFDPKTDPPYVWPEMLCSLGCETPRINDCKIGKKYRFFYAISSDVDAENPGMLIKVDTYEKTCATWCERHLYPSEPIFVSSPGAKDEDDGVVLSSIIWSGGPDRENRAGVLVLDAKSWTEIGRATFVTQSPVPKCLHGWYAADV